jgi:hypothetical protein
MLAHKCRRDREMGTCRVSFEAETDVVTVAIEHTINLVPSREFNPDLPLASEQILLKASRGTLGLLSISPVHSTRPMNCTG